MAAPHIGIDAVAGTAHAGGTYIFRPASSAKDESDRLDRLHAAFTDFLGNRLSFANFDGPPPASILEIGAGSGAWTADAAGRFPAARVVAVDINPLPPRPFPRNVEFCQADISQGLPFESSSFDVVHARLVMMHVPQPEQILERAIDLVKPGGWLIVEDPDDEQMLDGGGPLGPGMDTLLQGWFRVFRSRGLEPCIGRYLEEILERSDAFSEINVKKVTIPISEKSEDDHLNKFGKAWRTNMIYTGHDMPRRFAQQGMTQEVASAYLEELQDPARCLTTDMYFVWAKKKQAR